MLFLSVVMMLDVDFAELKQSALQYLPVGVLIGGIFLAELLLVVAAWVIGPGVPQAPASCPAPADDPRAGIERQARVHAHGSGVPLKRIAPSTICGIPQFALATSTAGGRIRRRGEIDDGCHGFEVCTLQLLPHAARSCLRWSPASSEGVMPIIAPPVGVEAQRGDHREPRGPRSRSPPPRSPRRGHGFDPEEIGPAAGQRCRLLRECLASVVQAQGPSGCRISPVGPRLPATSTVRPARSASARAMAAAFSLSSP